MELTQAGTLFDIPQTFDGSTYVARHDQARLSRQYLAVFALMRDGRWRTLDEISEATGEPSQSVSARLRDARKDKFGGHRVERRRRGEASRGVFEYRMEVMR